MDLGDQYFYYIKEIKPVLAKNSIQIVDSVSTDLLLEFPGPKASILVDPKAYNSQDGVLFFTPGKQPLFWTFDRALAYCKDGHSVVAQYFLCSSPK
jgi:hypothetical protein